MNAPHDGYTLLMTPSTITVLPAVTPNARYDAAKDFAAITQVAGINNVLVVHPSVPVQSLRELIALAKAKPGGVELRPCRRRLVAAYEHGAAQAHGRHRLCSRSRSKAPARR